MTQTINFDNYMALGSKKVVKETEKALCIQFQYNPTRFIEDEQTVAKWIPKSQCAMNEHGIYCVTKWFYYEKILPELEKEFYQYK